MKVIVHTCCPSDVPERKKWIQEELKLPIFKEEDSYDFGSGEYQFFLIVMNEEDLSMLQLKYPKDTFKIL